MENKDTVHLMDSGMPMAFLNLFLTAAAVET